jgi:electron-transferring-flavoprotein dehydrogenase
VPVTSNQHWVLTKTKKFNLPHLMMPSFLDNKGTFTGSLANLCRWLGGKAEELGVEIFPGFPAAEVLYNEDGSVKGVATGAMGIGRDGSPRATISPAWSCTPATPSSRKARAGA